MSLETIQLSFAAHKAPEFKTVSGSDWVLYGTDQEWRNRYPDYLLSLFNTSAKHNAIIRGKADYIQGNGFEVAGEELPTIQAAALQEFIRSNDLNELLGQVAIDIELFNGCAIEVIYNATMNRVARLSHVNFAKCRTNKDESVIYYSPDGWKKSKPEKVEPIPAFNASKPAAKSILYIKVYDPNKAIYPIPSYIGAVPYIELDGEIANFHLNGIKNGFMAGTIINFFNGQPTEEDRKAIEQKVNDKFAGSDNANKILLTFNDDKQQGPEIAQLNGNDLDKRFEALNATVQQEIFTGHRIVDPALFGIKPDGLFTSRNQIRDSYELFQKTYINARQVFIEGVFNNLAALNGLPKRLRIKPTEPIAQEFSEMTLVGVMTPDEIRAKAGLPPLQDAQAQQMSAQDSDIRLAQRFAECGLSLDEVEVIDSHHFTCYASLDDMQARESELLQYGFSDAAFDMAVLNLMSENPSMGMAEVAAALKTSIDAVQMAVNRSIQSGYLTLEITDVIGSTQRVAKITDMGRKALTTTKPLPVSYSVAYRYVLGPGVAGPEIMPTTRDFCAEMVQMSKNRVWTQADITRLSLSEDRNVWQRRGGFWTRKGTNTTTHYCRHAWERVLIRKK
jgi:hypothetical protein